MITLIHFEKLPLIEMVLGNIMGILLAAFVRIIQFWGLTRGQTKFLTVHTESGLKIVAPFYKQELNRIAGTAAR